MPKSDWVSNSVEKLFTERGLYPQARVSTILDVACGLSLKSQYMTADIRVGVDIYEPYLRAIEASVPYALVCLDVNKLRSVFIEQSFDVVILLDIIEHLEKEDALHLIQAAKEIAKMAVIVETPEGFIPQDIDIWGLGGHDFQTHRSGWSVDELENLEFACFTREYEMSEVRRHTEIEVDTQIRLIDGIWIRTSFDL